MYILVHLQNVPKQNVQTINVWRHNIPDTKCLNYKTFRDMTSPIKTSQIQNFPNTKVTHATKRPSYKMPQLENVPLQNVPATKQPWLQTSKLENVPS